MATPTTNVETLDLSAKFSGVTADERPGYSGWIVEKDKLVEVATALRDEYGYDLLSSVTGVDYLPEEKWKWSTKFTRPSAARD